jgi:mono/diheme cytochrome c family protein
VWRALYFRPGSWQPEPAQDARWNRGAYLVRGVAHCSACHATRDALGGADWRQMRGSLLGGQGWYAPSLHDAREAGLADWPTADIARLLQTGVTEHGRASGPWPRWCGTAPST